MSIAYSLKVTVSLVMHNYARKTTVKQQETEDGGNSGKKL